jgi:diguanylate cyclase
LAAILLVDVDRFKSINDRYGHGMGDVVLKRIAALLREHVREIDLPARYGGDEFAVLLVDSDVRRAVAIAERILIQARELVFEAEPGLACTLSIGVAELADDHPALEQWVRAADAALYRAKAAGRNRVVAA